MKLQTFVFDFDGTLAKVPLDFSEMKKRLSSLAQTCRAPVPPPPFLPVLEWLAWLEKNIQQLNGGSDCGFRSRALALISEMEFQAAKMGSLFPFTRPLLRSLIERHVKIAIITRNCGSAVRIVFPDIDDYSNAFLPRDSVVSPKPDPGHLLRALESIGADNRTAIMIGDHPMDIETGRAAGVMTAGVCSGSSCGEDLRKAGADLVAENCAVVVRLLCEKAFI